MQASLFDRLVRVGTAERVVSAPAARPAVELRPYQVEADRRIVEQLERVRSTLVVMATGTGKTTVFANRIAQTRGRCLVLAHRDELIQQAARRIREQTGKMVSIEKAEDRASFAAQVVVASVQTLSQPKTIRRLVDGELRDSVEYPRLQRFGKAEFELVIADEAHHYVAPSFRRILDYFEGAKVLGVTATPDRADELAMGSVFDDVAYVYEIEDAIADGFLCPIRATQVVCGDIDLADVKTTAGDLNQGELDAVMSTEAALHQVARPTLELAGGRRTLVFTTSVENAHRLAEVFNRYRAGSAAAVDGSMAGEERRRVLADHQAGRFQFLCNVAVLTEGYDDPAIACVAMGRPTKSRALYAQMAGRGTRIAPGKDDLLILDFVGNSGKHALVSAVDILAGRWPEDVVEAARKRVAENPGMNARDALAQADAELKAAKEAEARRRAKAKARVKYTAKTVDPFRVMGIADPSEEFGARFGDATASEAQLGVLARFKIPVPEGLTKRAASRLIGEAIRRREKGLCSFGQARALQRQGYDTTRMSFIQASRLMDALARNGWRLTPEQQAAALERTPGEDDT